jgi:membrane-bound lytic murein transglycosylase D
VPKILAAAIVGHNLAAFGYGGIVADPPFVYDRVEVPPGTALATVARATKAKVELLVALNPQIVRERTPPGRGKYFLRLPPGTAAAFAEAFERSRTGNDNLETVTLRFGETLEAVAKARGITVRELRRLNGVKDSSELRAGVAIVVPARSAKTVKAVTNVAPTAAEEDESAPRAGADDPEILVAVPDRVFNYEGRERVFYRTRNGDTVEDIAAAAGVRPEDLVDWNNLDVGAKLHPKMVLQIFVRKDFDPTPIVLLDSARVRVVTLGSQEFLELEAARRGKKRLVIEAKSGDTLARMGRRYGLTVGDLARINRFSYKTDLQEGQKVVVYSPVGEGPREVVQGSTGEARRERARALSARDTDAARPSEAPRQKVHDTVRDKVNDKSAARAHDGSTDRPTDKGNGKPARVLGEQKVASAARGKLAPARSVATTAGGAKGKDKDKDKDRGRGRGMERDRADAGAKSSAKAPVKAASKKK